MAENCIIYKLYFNDPAKFYIGSAIDFNTRYRKHKWYLKDGTHVNRHLQRAWNNCNIINYEIIEYCIPDNILEREQYYIDTLKPHYNICRQRVNNRLGTKHTEETIKKMSQTQKNSWTEEKRKRMSVARKGMRHNIKNRKITDEIVQEIRRLIALKFSNKTIAEIFNTQTSTVSRIKTKKLYNYVH